MTHFVRSIFYERIDQYCYLLRFDLKISKATVIQIKYNSSAVHSGKKLFNLAVQYAFLLILCFRHFLKPIYQVDNKSKMSGVILNQVAWMMVNQKYFKENFVLTESQE